VVAASRRARPSQCRHYPRAPLQRPADALVPPSGVRARADGRDAASAEPRGRPCRAVPSRRRPSAGPPGAAAARARCRERCRPSSAGPPRAGTRRPSARRLCGTPCPRAGQDERPAGPSLASRDPSCQDLAHPGLTCPCPIGGAHAGVRSPPTSVARRRCAGEGPVGRFGRGAGRRPMPPRPSASAGSTAPSGTPRSVDRDDVGRITDTTLPRMSGGFGGSDRLVCGHAPGRETVEIGGTEDEPRRPGIDALISRPNRHQDPS
jgi:hypothetical protein